MSIGTGRLAQALVGASMVAVLAAGVTAAVVVKEPDSYPAEWDGRVVDLVSFVERARGHDFLHPVFVDFLTAEEYSEQTRTDASSLSKEDREEIAQAEGLLRALGLASEDHDLIESSNDLADGGTLAFYRYSDERVVVRGTDVTPALAATLVHELTHVLQDQIFGLDRFDPDDESITSGQLAAFAALVEGDANRVEARYVDEILTDAERDALAAENGAGPAPSAGAGDVPVALEVLSTFQYPLGDALLAILGEDGDNAIDRAFADPPTTEEHLLDPFQYLARDGVFPMETPSVGTMKVIQEGDFGAVSLLVVLAERIDPRDALIAATGWGGDAFVVFEMEGKTCARIAVRADTPDDLDEMEAAFNQWVGAAPAGTARTERNDEELLLESCDPGGSSAEGSGGSVEAIELALAKTFFSVGTQIGGVSRSQARCFGRELMYGFASDPDRRAGQLTALIGGEDAPALEALLNPVIAGCR